jgi:hypothetical protein
VPVEAGEVETHMLSGGLMLGDEDVMEVACVGGEVASRGGVVAVEEEEVIHGPVVEAGGGGQHCQGL